MNISDLKNSLVNKKYLWIFLAVVVLAGLVWFVFDKNYNKKFVLIENDEQLGEFLKNAKDGDIERYLAGYKKAQAEDLYGGDTPEETMELFIDALKAGDTELAAKYFVLERQKKMAGDFAVGKENGGIETFLGYLEDIDKGSMMSNGSYRFTVYEDSHAPMYFDLVLNPETNKWKLESL